VPLGQVSRRRRGFPERSAQLLEVELPCAIERRCDRHYGRTPHGPAAARAFPRRCNSG